MSETKTVVHVIESLKTGGAQKLLSDLLPALKESQVNVCLIVAHRENNSLEETIEKAGIEIINFDTLSLKSLKFCHLLRDYLKSHVNDISLVHVHLFPTLYIVPWASRGLNIPLVYTEHSTHNKRRDKKYLRPLERLVYSKYSRLIGISDETSKALEKWSGQKIGDKILTIPNGVDLKPFLRTEELHGSDGSDHPMILMVSRFVPAKDQETVIRCIPMVNDRNVEFHFAGEGDTLEYHRQLARDYGVSDRCVFHGNVENVAELMHSATIGVQSSHWEGFGLTAIEFMATGIPVIASNVPGLNDVVRGAGLLFENGDSHDLANKINLMLSDNSGFVDNLIENGLMRAKDYDIKKTASLTNRIYTEIVN